MNREQAEIQRLRTALGILANKNNWFETYDSIVPTIAWAGGNKTPYEIANEALSATTESTGAERVREIWNNLRDRGDLIAMDAVEKTLSTFGIVIPGINAPETEKEGRTE